MERDLCMRHSMLTTCMITLGNIVTQTAREYFTIINFLIIQVLVCLGEWIVWRACATIGVGKTSFGRSAAIRC